MSSAGLAVIAAAPGAVTIAHREVLRASVREALGSNPIGCVLDLSAAGDADSVGLGTLVKLNKEAREQGKRLVLAAPSASLRELFRITALDSILNVKGSVLDAVVSA